MARNSGQPARDLFPGHNVGAGKGDKPRTNLGSPAWRANYDDIDWSGSVSGFVRSGRRLVKRYGVSLPPKLTFEPLPPMDECQRAVYEMCKLDLASPDGVLRKP